MMSRFDKLSTINDRLVAAARDIKVLSRLSWPAAVQQEFLDAWRTGRPRLPRVSYAIDPMHAARAELQSIANGLDRHDPLECYVAETAESYVQLCLLLERAGTVAISEISAELYGRPTDRIVGSDLTGLDSARHFIDVSRSFQQLGYVDDQTGSVPPSVIAAELQRRTREVLRNHPIEVVIDDHLASKAAAGMSRIRIRGSACFSQYDLEQLLQHEALVHSLTAINGHSQLGLSCFGLSAPRTTGTQEGLATFAELVTGTMDLTRLTRIALRVVAIDQALNGRDFLDLFKFFLEAGQPEIESFNSAMRVFRGAAERWLGIHQGHGLSARADVSPYVLSLGVRQPTISVVRISVCRPNDDRRRLAVGTLF